MIVLGCFEALLGCQNGLCLGYDSKLAKMQSANHSEIDEHVGTPDAKA